MTKVEQLINKLIKREIKRLEKQNKECVKNAYNPNKDDWNKEHFDRCDGDITAGKLDILEEIKKKLLEK